MRLAELKFYKSGTRPPDRCHPLPRPLTLMGPSIGVRFLLASLLSLLTTHVYAALNYSFPYGSQKVRGVNLGGWLVLEVSLRSP